MSLISESQRFRQERAALIRDHFKTAAALSKALTANAEGHLQRWVFELLQNADDAGSDTCEIVVSDGTLIVADNGSGLNPGSVESLATPFQSDKSGEGTIGRKGVGFSAVYELTDEPVLLSAGEAVTFSKRRFSDWLQNEPGIERFGSNAEDFPFLYALVPFGINAEDAEQELPLLADVGLKGGTRVAFRLRDPDAVEREVGALRTLDFTFLLNFAHLRRVVVRDASAVPVVEVSLTCGPEDGGSDDLVWKLRVKRGDHPDELTEFRVWNRIVRPSEELLNQQFAESSTRSAMREVRMRLAYPLDQEGNLQRATSGHDRTFLVYYPTEDPSPFQTLLHADFVIESNRKHLLRPRACKFNEWLLKELASFLAESANRLSLDGRWKDALSLLMRREGVDTSRNEEPCGFLWRELRDSIAKRVQFPTGPEPSWIFAKDLVVLPPNRPRAELAVLGELIWPNARIAIEELGLEKTDRKILRDLGVRVLDDKTVIEHLEKPPAGFPADQRNNWVWSAWNFLDSWYHDDNGWKPKKERDERLKRLKVLPGEDDLESPGRHWCYRRAEAIEGDQELPDWLPVAWLPEVLAERLLRASGPTILETVKMIGVTPFHRSDILRALAKVASDFWSTPEGQSEDPGRLLSFLLRQPWLSNALEANFDGVSLGKVPVPASSCGQALWGPADKVYFGSAWDNEDLELVMGDKSECFWLRSGDKFDQKLFEVLGVARAPRLVKAQYGVPDQLWQRLADGMPRYWSTNRARPEAQCQNSPEVRDQLRIFDSIRLPQLNSLQAQALLRLVFECWESFRPAMHIEAEYSYYGTHTISADNIWWDEIKQIVKPMQKVRALGKHVALGQTWVRRSPNWAKCLFPEIDTASLGTPRDIEALLRDSNAVRSKTEDTQLSEWIEWSKRCSEVLIGMPEKEAQKTIRMFYDGFMSRLKIAMDRDGLSGERLKHEIQHDALCWFREGIESWPCNEVWVVRTEAEFRRWSQHLHVLLIEERHGERLVEAFGFRLLSRSLTEELDSSIEATVDEKLEKQVRLGLALLHVYRRVKRDVEGGNRRWHEISCLIASDLRVNCRLISESRVLHAFDEERRYFVKKNPPTLFVAKGSAGSGKTLADGLALLLVLSDADRMLLEALLSQTDHEAMKVRLLEEGIDDYQIQEGIDEFYGIDPEPATLATSPPETPPTPVSSLPVNQSPLEPSSQPREPGIHVTRHAPSPPDKGESKLPVHLSLRMPGSCIAEIGCCRPTESQTLAPSRPEDTPQNSRQGFVRSDSSSSNFSGDESQSEDVLSTSQKHEIEDCSRAWVKAAMEEQGFQVKEMSRNNPGYDLLAKKNGEEILVEVKGHRKQPSKFNITPTELGLSQKQTTDGSWMLWVVANLDAYSEVGVTLTPIKAIGSVEPTGYLAKVGDCTQAPWPPEIA